MQILHMVGHRHNWNLDTYYKNGIGDGFIFCAYSFDVATFNKPTLNKYPLKDILDRSFLDLQYYGKKESGNIAKGNLASYDFHPAHDPNNDQHTDVYFEVAIRRGIEFQISIGLKNVIIPMFYENDNIEKFLGALKSINRWLSKHKVDGVRYFMTIPITHHTIIDAEKIDKLLYCLTDMDIIFDGYYILCESKPDNMQKVSTDYKYLNNLGRVFQVLKKQKFTTIYAYANWDAIVFLSITDIDYISIASYENLRNFSIKRFLITEDGGPSKGWYYSEKLLNFVKAPLLDLVRMQGGIEIIRNERNIFSDDILRENYPWSNQKPEVHKNYMLSVERTLKQVASIEDINERRDFVLKLIDKAIQNYQALTSKRINFTNESKNYHLETWQNYLLTK
jgi:hypothetical protein